MPFNGSGLFQRIMDWTNDASAAIKIRADRHDQNDDDLASGLSNCICRDGQSTISANVPWNNKKITNLAYPTDMQDAASKQYVDDKPTRIETIIDLTSTQTYTFPAGVTHVDLELCGGGASGGGVTAGTASDRAACGGGGSGGCGRTGPIALAGETSMVVSIGAAGAGASGGGNDGGNTAVTLGGTTYTATGGTRGIPITATSANSVLPGGLGGSCINFKGGGNTGQPGMFVGVNQCLGGAGASSPFGTGGQSNRLTSGSSAGSNANGRGAGGGGAVTNAVVVTTAGGNGTAGLVRVHLYKDATQ